MLRIALAIVQYFTYSSLILVIHFTLIIVHFTSLSRIVLQHTNLCTILQYMQSDHLSGENLEMSGNLTAVRDLTKNQGIVREKILLGKSCLKRFIVRCIFVSIQVFSTSTGMI